MQIVVGNKTKELDAHELATLAASFAHVLIDLGTGDGRFVYKSAKNDPTRLYIGIDPSVKQLEEYAKKATREKLGNVVFVVGNIDTRLDELAGLADKLSILLPWGTLLETVVKPKSHQLENVKFYLKPAGLVELIFGYDPALEPSETKRLNLEQLTEQKVRETVLPQWKSAGFKVVSLEVMIPEMLRELETTWSKKLGFGHEREMFRLVLRKV